MSHLRLLTINSRRISGKKLLNVIQWIAPYVACRTFRLLVDFFSPRHDPRDPDIGLK